MDICRYLAYWAPLFAFKPQSLWNLPELVNVFLKDSGHSNPYVL